MSDTIKKERIKCKYLREKKRSLMKKKERIERSILKCGDLLNIEYMLEKSAELDCRIQSLSRRGV